jgi:hypothetical protein
VGEGGGGVDLGAATVMGGGVGALLELDFLLLAPKSRVGGGIGGLLELLLLFMFFQPPVGVSHKILCIPLSWARDSWLNLHCSVMNALHLVDLKNRQITSKDDDNYLIFHFF